MNSPGNPIAIAWFAELSFSKKMTMSTVQRHKSLAIKVKHTSFFSTKQATKNARYVVQHNNEKLNNDTMKNPIENVN